MMGEYLFIPKNFFFFFWYLQAHCFFVFFLNYLVFFTIILFVKRVGVLQEYKKISGLFVTFW
jgi:hypothetical protein